MSEVLKEVAEKLEQARSSRKKGDALRNANREEAARAAYGVGVATLKDALTLLRLDEMRIDTLDVPPTREQKKIIDELVEIYGTLGGMYQRLDWIETAAESYERGAGLEEHFKLPSTYNRLNAIKCLLLTGKYRLRELEPRIRALAGFIEDQLRGSARQSGSDHSDSGWAWADLGDCLALLDDRDGARRAYMTFISKAEIKAPERTLQILKKIAAQLHQFDDPDAGRLDSAIETLERQLVT